MERVILIERADGGLTVRIPARKARRRNETEEDFLDRIGSQMARKRLSGARVLGYCLKSALPTSRRFRRAWKGSQAGIAASVEIDVKKAKDVLLEEVRRERNVRLDASDKEKVRLDDIGPAADREDLAEKRQKLRDLPEAVEKDIKNMSVEELEEYTPEWPE